MVKEGREQYYLPTIVVYVYAACSGAPHNTIEADPALLQ